jgi:hypothetical protein
MVTATAVHLSDHNRVVAGITTKPLLEGAWPERHGRSQAKSSGRG